MNQSRKKTILSVAGLILLILVLCVGIQMIYVGLGEAIPKSGPASSASQSLQPDPSQSGDLSGGAGQDHPAPSFCPFCGESLPSAFRWGQFCPYCGEQVEA